MGKENTEQNLVSDNEPVNDESPAAGEIKKSDESTSPKNKPGGKKRLLLILLGLVIVLAVGAAVYFVAKKTKTAEPAVVDTNTVSEVTETPEPKKTEPAPTPEGCLAPADYDKIYKEITGQPRGSETTYGGEASNFSQSVFFNVNSTDFGDQQAANDKIINAYAQFAKDNAKKEFKFKIVGTYVHDNQAENDMATKRANKLKDSLVSKGVHESLIVVEKPASIDKFAPGSVEAAGDNTSQSAIMEIDPTCTN